MDDLFLPLTVEDLITLLDKMFPNECARLTDSERKIFHKAGQRSVVDWLLELQRRTEEEQLQSTME